MSSSRFLPKPEVIQRLAISDNGFVFDPVTGHSFTVNATGLDLLRLMARGESVEAMVSHLIEAWDVDPHMAERDLLEFAAELRKALQV